MSWEAAGALGEIIGAIAVIASLLFVGYQLRQGQMVERAAGQRDILKQGREWFRSTQTNPELFRVVSKVLMSGYDSADPDEQQQFFSWAFDFFQIAEQAFYMHRDGYLNEASFEGAINVAMSITRSPGGAEWWAHTKTFWGQDASNYLSQRLSDAGEDVPVFHELFPYFESKFHAESGERKSSPEIAR